MKIIHTGDWHIGKLINGIHMTKDQKHILDKLIDLIDKEKADVLLIAGDIYDRSQPPVEAIELLDDFFSKIILKHNTKIIAIAGNHDNPSRVGFASKILKDEGLYLSGNLESSVTPISISDEFGEVDFYPIPFCEPSKVKEIYSDDNITSHDLAMDAIIRNIKKDMDMNKRNICIAHGFIMGTDSLETSESERPLSIGGTEYINVEYFKDFNYVALGHLHNPQKVKYDYIRYSGSLLKYSFSEANHEKSVSIIDMDKDGNTKIRKLVLEPIRDMRVIKGNIDKLTDKKIYSLANTNDYIKAILTDKGELIDPISTLRAVYPNILRLEREELLHEAGESKTAASEDFIKLTTLELFKEFYENVSGEEFNEDKNIVLKNILSDIEKSERLS